MTPNLKPWLLAAALTLPFGSTALAQEPAPAPAPTPAPEMDGEGEAEPAPERERRDRRSRRAMMRGGMGLPLDQMKEQLGLSEDQVKRFETMNEEMRKQMEQVREQMRAGTFDPTQMRDTFRKGREEMQAKIKEILTPEQQQKFEELRAQRGRRGGREGREGGRRGGREALTKRLRAEAVKALALAEEEAAVVLPLLDGVMETKRLVQEEQERRREQFLEKVRETTDPETLQKLLQEYRSAREAEVATVFQSQKQLRDVLTVEQEAKLVGLNVLD